MLLALALLAVVPTPEPARIQARTNLERLVLDCDRIVRARVKEIHEFDGSVRREGTVDPALIEPKVRVLELEVEEVFWGDPKTKSLFVLDDTFHQYLRLHGQPQRGDESLWFLELDPWFSKIDAQPQTRITELTGPSGLQVVAADGLGRLMLEKHDDLEVVCLRSRVWDMPAGLMQVGTHVTDDPPREWTQVSRSEFDKWLRESIREHVPSIEVEVRMYSMFHPNLSIDERGHAQLTGTRDGDKTLEIGADGLLRILEIASKERFFELPVQLGHSTRQEPSTYKLRIRTSAGGRQVRIWGPSDPEKDDRAVCEAHARAMRVWESLPIVGDWQITAR